MQSDKLFKISVCGTLFSYSLFSDTLFSEKHNFLNTPYLAEPYLFFYLPRFNKKLKLMKKAPRNVIYHQIAYFRPKALNFCV